MHGSFDGLFYQIDGFLGNPGVGNKDHVGLEDVYKRQILSEAIPFHI